MHSEIQGPRLMERGPSPPHHLVAVPFATQDLHSCPRIGRVTTQVLKCLGSEVIHIISTHRTVTRPCATAQRLERMVFHGSRKER